MPNSNSLRPLIQKEEKERKRSCESVRVNVHDHTTGWPQKHPTTQFMHTGTHKKAETFAIKVPEIVPGTVWYWNPDQRSRAELGKALQGEMLQGVQRREGPDTVHRIRCLEQPREEARRSRVN